VHIVRRDRARQAISWLRAAQDGVWVVSDEHPANPLASPAYDFDVLVGMQRLIVDGENGWRRLFEEIGVSHARILGSAGAATRQRILAPRLRWRLCRRVARTDREGDRSDEHSTFMWWLSARDDATGELVGYTELALSPYRTWLANQGDTAVHPDHRDRGVGRWLRSGNTSGNHSAVLMPANSGSALSRWVTHGRLFHISFNPNTPFGVVPTR
jgi:GNAT superfamily N-acetyltransferase